MLISFFLLNFNGATCITWAQHASLHSNALQGLVPDGPDRPPDEVLVVHVKVQDHSWSPTMVLGMVL